MAEPASKFTNVNATGALKGGGVKQQIVVPLGAVSATTSWIVAIPDFAGTIDEVLLATKDAVTANDTNYWTFALTNKGQAGAGSTTIATRHTKATGGLGMAAYTHYDVTVNTANNAVVAEDVLLFTATKAASATALAEAVLVLNYTPTDV